MEDNNYGKYLSTIKKNLNKGETICESVFGMCDNVRTGVMAATENRVIFYEKKLFGHGSESFPYNRISSIERSKGMMAYGITIFTSNNKAKMKWVISGGLTRFMDFAGKAQPGRPRKREN